MKLNYTIEELKGKTRALCIKDIRNLIAQKKEVHNIMCETRKGYVKKVGIFDQNGLMFAISRRRYQKVITPELSFN